MPAVCVFCASSLTIDQRYLDLAREVGDGDRRAGLGAGVRRAGSISMMGEVGRAARAAGGHTVGVIPDALVAMEVADHDSDEFIVTRDMRQRKGIMDERSDAFLALPGRDRHPRGTGRGLDGPLAEHAPQAGGRPRSVG